MKYKEIIKILMQAGFVMQRKKGSHEVFHNGQRTIVVPRRNGYDINKHLLKKIFKDAGIEA